MRIVHCVRWAGRLGRIVASSAALIALVSRLGVWLEPADFLNQFALLWLAGGIAGALIALAAGPGGATLAASALLILVVVGAQIVAPEIPRPAWSEAATGDRLRIVQFNLWKDNPDPAAAAAWLAAQGADVVVLQETIGRGPGVPSLLRRAFPFQQSCVDRGPCSTVLLSRRRPIASGGLAQADPENRRGLSAAWMRLPGRCGAFTLVGVHFSRPWPWRGGAEDRSALLRLLGGRPRARLIVAGDFNLSAATFAMRRFEARLGTRRATGLLPTWPSRAGGWRLPAVIAIDQIHAGADWRAGRAVRGDPSGSDHLPVVATLYDTACAPARRDATRGGEEAGRRE